MATKTKSVTLTEIQDLSVEERSVYVSWTFKDSDHAEKYEYTWQYCVNNVWFSGSSGSVEANKQTPKRCTYSYPEEATNVKVFVKPVSKKKDKKSYYFVGSAKSKSKVVSTLLPDRPSEPSVSISDFTLTASVTITDSNAKTVQFEFVRADTGGPVGNPLPAGIIAQQATVQITATNGWTYRVRCRAANAAGSYGPWSNFSSDTEGETPPGAIVNAPRGSALSSNSIYVEWDAADNADEYILQYTIQKRFFDAVPDQVHETSELTVTHTELQGLETDYSYTTTGEWYFRVKAKNDKGESGWSPIGSCPVGKKPDPPTTWSSRATASPGDDIYLYWTHNSTDSSREVDAKLRLNINGTIATCTVPNETTQDEDTGTHRYHLTEEALSNGDWTIEGQVNVHWLFVDGANIKWTVQTRGAIAQYSEPSIEREINIYAPPSLSLYLGAENKWYWDNLEFSEESSIHTTAGELTPMEVNEFGVQTLTKYPFYIRLNSSPLNQTPVSYNIAIIADEAYSDVDELGNSINVRAGQEVYSRYIVSSEHSVLTYVLPTDINLYDGINYKILATLAMDSGLGAEAASSFAVDLEEPEDIILDAESIYDEERIALSLAPYCEDEEANPVPGMTLAIHRKQADGSFVEIASGLPSELRTFVVDPHPNLGDCSYRIVGTLTRTGRMYFVDIMPDPIPETAIIIQWDEDIRAFDESTVNEDELVESPHSGTTLKLPYNVDIQDTTNPDVAFVQYIGRKHPVSYYGTHIGETAQWTCEIPKDDTETIALLRHLQAWMGDAYVRERSGLGYWAQVKPSFNLEHCKVTVPVTLAITRVEGGI